MPDASQYADDIVKSPDVATAVGATMAEMFGPALRNAIAAEEAANAEAGAPVVEAPEPQIEDTDELPDDIAALLDEPDLELEPDEEPDLSEYQDADELARELARTRKRNKYLEEQTLVKSRKEWRRESKKYFPYADLDTITATSRRGFLRDAKAQHDQIKGRVEAAIAAERKKLTVTQTAEQAAKREADAAAWGKPVTGGAPSTVPATTTADERLQDARKRNNLTGAVRALIERGDI